MTTENSCVRAEQPNEDDAFSYVAETLEEDRKLTALETQSQSKEESK